MPDAELMPLVIGQWIVENEVFEWNADFPDIVQERGDSEGGPRDMFPFQLGS